MNEKRAPGDHWALLIIFFPITLYFFIGTFMYFVLYLSERGIQKLAHYSRAPGFVDYTATEWHRYSVTLTVIFPVVWPVMAIATYFVIFPYVLTASSLKAVRELLRIIWQRTLAAFTWIKDFLGNVIHYIWRSTLAAFMSLKAIMGEAIYYVWKTVTRSK